MRYRLHQKLSTHLRKLVMELLARLPCSGRRPPSDHIPRIEAFLHIHERDTGLFVPGYDSSLYRRCTSEPRKQRPVYIHTSLSRYVQHFLWKQLTVCSYYDKIRRRVSERFYEPFVFSHLLRLHHFKSQLQRLFLHRREFHLFAAIPQRIRLSHDKRYLVAFSVKSFKRRYRKVRSPHINDLHLSIIPPLLLSGTLLLPCRYKVSRRGDHIHGT